MLIQICIASNIYSVSSEALDHYYGGDVKFAEKDGCAALYRVIGQVARETNLIFVGPCSGGAVWEGTKGNVNRALNKLPEWAHYSIPDKPSKVILS